MIEPLAVAVHAVRRFGDITGKSVLVLGGGTIGNLVAQTAKALGAGKVLLSELSAYRLETAKKTGIEVVDPAQTDLKERIGTYFGPDGTDVVFECVGINTTMNQAIEYARKGSTIIAVGVFGEMATMNAALIQDHELTLIGTAMYRTPDFTTAIDLVGGKRIEFEPLITDHVPFDDYLRAYKVIDEQKDKAMKVIVVFDD
jgi:L-iditol 2-dehydrogenase